MRGTLLLVGIGSLAFSPAHAAHPAEDAATEIVELFYDYRSAEAIAAAKALQTQHPAYPAGLFYESVAYYQRYLLEEPRRPETFAAFLKLNQAALDQAVQMKKMSPALSHYYQGAALGFQARAYVAQKKYVLAIPNARHGASHLKKALEMDPTLQDANFGLGMYYYFLARVPAAAKPFAYLMVGMKGDRQKGLALLEQTIEQGRVARVEAKSVLAAIYASEKEKEWNEAERLLRELMRDYPHNPRYHLSLIYVLQRKGLWQDAAAAADSQAPWLAELDESVKSRAQGVIRYRAAENFLFLGRYEEALPLLQSLEAESHLKGLKDWTSLRLGNYWDATGQAEKAKPYYQAIRDKKARDLADHFRKTSFPPAPTTSCPTTGPSPTSPQTKRRTAVNPNGG